jgi:hypothetical protein
MATETTALSNGTEEDGGLEAGQMKLFSYHVPSLPAGNYTIDVNHEIFVPGNPLPSLNSVKKFRITAPRYVLPPDSVHSCYPHHGHGEGAHVLPHILFNDPHLPWERVLPDEANGSTKEATQMPWLAILTFEVDELQVTNPPPELASLKASTSMSYHMPLSTLWKMNSTTCLPFPEADMTNPDDIGLDAERPDGEKSTTNVDVIFLKDALFKSLFGQQKDGESDKSFQLSLERYKYLAHVRIVHTHGMAQAAGGVTTQGEDKEFSVIVSPRCGPTHLLNKTNVESNSPISMVAHLVSLDGIEENLKSIPAEKQNVGLVSLYSWSYECLPPNSIDYGVLMENLTDTMQPFRMPQTTINEMTGERSMTKNGSENEKLPIENGKANVDKPQEPAMGGPESKWLKDRLNDGYTFIKYRPTTGESTVALYRGPLIPRANNRDTRFDLLNSNGSDLQILDHSSGLPDISYHMAWELGRSLASSDRFFSGAMMRIRAEIQSTAHNRYLATLEKAGLSTTKSYLPQDMLVKNIKETLTKNLGASSETGPTHDASMHRRWNKHVILEPVDDNLEDPDMTLHIQDATDSITHKEEEALSSSQKDIASSAVKSGSGTTTAAPVQKGHPDWAIISQWCVDKLMLKNIPTVYIFPDPDALPEEALRTFYLDETWMNSFIDGALSVANHALYTEPDLIRTYLKVSFNNILLKQSDIQIPKWGFFIRSKVIQVFPDLRIVAPWPDKSSAQSQIARMDHLAPDTLMCLFDRRPDDGQFPDGITISQPPHQQRFSVGTILTDMELEISYKMMATRGTQQEAAKKRTNAHLKFYRENGKGDTGLKPIFDWESRCLIFPQFAQSCIDQSKQLGSDFFDIEMKANSALVGIELNDLPLTMKLEHKSISGSPKANLPRQIPTGATKQTGQLSSNKPPVDPSFATESVVFLPKSIQHNPVFPFPHPRGNLQHAPPKLRANIVFNPLLVDEKRASAPAPVTSLAPATTSSLFSNTSLVLAAAPQSQLCGSVFPLLLRGRNIPTKAGSQGLDLVFSITAAPHIPEDIILSSVTVIVPAGNDPKDLLRVTYLDPTMLAVLPSVRTVGKGKRWVAVGRELTKRAVDYRPVVRRRLRSKIPTCCFVVKLSPKGGTTGKLVEMPDLSFVLVGADINGMPSTDVVILFVEQYSKLGYQGELVDAGTITSEVHVEKESATLV